MFTYDFWMYPYTVWRYCHNWLRYCVHRYITCSLYFFDKKIHFKGKIIRSFTTSNFICEVYSLLSGVRRHGQQSIWSRPVNMCNRYWPSWRFAPFHYTDRHERSRELLYADVFMIKRSSKQRLVVNKCVHLTYQTSLITPSQSVRTSAVSLQRWLTLATTPKGINKHKYCDERMSLGARSSGSQMCPSLILGSQQQLWS